MIISSKELICYSRRFTAMKISSFNIFTDDTDEKNNSEDLWDRITSAVWLISIGVIFLLNTLNILPWFVWAGFFAIIANWWPLFIIAAGISVIFDNFTLGKIITGIFWYLLFVALFIAGVELAYRSNYDLEDGDFPRQFIETIKTSRDQI